MTTGLHVVRDVFCIGCNALLGWSYVRAYEASQRYKEGKVILERKKLARRRIQSEGIAGWETPNSNSSSSSNSKVESFEETSSSSSAVGELE